ncbi:MAG: hypothetical protein KC776_16870 [Myxococcales bacterium]|nr:hypothetical protein [Myxococcales bacterium]MCB9575516.1 hypothetical protein [Polyangiaceae bacterium]
MAHRISLVLGIAALLVASAGQAGEKPGIEFGLAFSENGAALKPLKLAASGGKVPLPRGAWKCEYGKPEATTPEGGRTKGTLTLKCSMGAAVVQLSTTCSYTDGPARSESDVLRDVQGVTLTVPNGAYRAYLALSCKVHDT